MDGEPGEMNEDEGRMVWRVWPAREQPGRAVLGLVLIFLTAGVVGFYGGASGGSTVEGVLWGVGAIFIFGTSLSKFFFVTEFVIDDEGIYAKYLTGKKGLKWGRVKRFVHRDGLGYLSTRSKVSWLDGYRGMMIRFGDDGGEVIARIEELVKSGKSGG